jgi:hypothetical protein
VTRAHAGDGRTAIEFRDAGPDPLGRRRFCLYWRDGDGVARPEMLDGHPVGHRRAQVFFCDPQRVAPGAEVVSGAPGWWRP